MSYTGMGALVRRAGIEPAKPAYKTGVVDQTSGVYGSGGRIRTCTCTE